MSIPKHELHAQRLEALEHYGDLDAPYDPGLQELVAFASELCGVPISLVSFVADDRQRFRAELGLGLSETPIEESICAHAMLHPGVFEVRDATKDVRLQNHPAVTGPLAIRFYAGVAIQDRNGFPLGSFCVIDKEPRALTDFQRRSLQLLGRQAEARLDLLRRLRELKEEREVRVRANAVREEAMTELEAEQTRLRSQLDLFPPLAA